MGSSLVPLSNSDEKAASGRWSARHDQGSHEKKKKAINNYEVRSVADSSQAHHRAVDPLGAAENFERRSLDAKGHLLHQHAANQTAHRSAIHSKNQAALLPKAGAAQSN